MNRILLIEIYNSEVLNIDLPYIDTCNVLVSVNSNVLYFSPNSHVFHIPFTFALKISKICIVSTSQVADHLHEVLKLI